MKSLLISIILAAILTSGCASRAPFGSFAGPLPGKPAVEAIADDAVSILAELYPPGHTSLAVIPAKDAENGFAVAFESGLRAKGFILAAPDSSDAFMVAYTLDMLEEKAAWYLRLRLSDGKDVRVMARAYDAHGQAEAGQSRTVFEASRSGLGKAVDAVKEKADDISAAAANFWRQAEMPLASESPQASPEGGDSVQLREEQRHLVQRGDTLKKIAAQYNVPPQAIMQRNKLTSPDLVLLGHTLIIPAPVEQ
jgi:hypothetical protein